MDLIFFDQKKFRESGCITQSVLPAKLLARAGMVVSQSEGRRLVVGGIVKLNDNPITDLSATIEVKIGEVLTVGHNRRVEITQEILDQL